MRYVLWTIVGLVVLGVVAVGGGVYWFANVKVDFSDPQMAGKFKETFNKNCMANFEKSLAKSGATVSDQQAGQVESTCTCARDGVVDALARRAPMTVSDLATMMGEDPEILGITKACADKFGIENPT